MIMTITYKEHTSRIKVPIETKKIVIDEVFGKPYLVVKKDENGGWKNQGTSYEIRAITSLLEGDRGFFLCHDKDVADRLRNDWKNMPQRHPKTISTQELKDNINSKWTPKF